MDDWESDQANTWERQSGKSSIPSTQGTRYREAIKSRVSFKATTPEPTAPAIK